MWARESCSCWAHHQQVPSTKYRGGELPPETKLLPLEDQLPLRGSTYFDDQLTRPLHANLLLQHETEGIHTTKKLK